MNWNLPDFSDPSYNQGVRRAIDIGGEEVGLIEFLDNILGSAPEESRDMLFMAFEQALQGGSRPSKN